MVHTIEMCRKINTELKFVLFHRLISQFLGSCTQDSYNSEACIFLVFVVFGIGNLAFTHWFCCSVGAVGRTIVPEQCEKEVVVFLVGLAMQQEYLHCSQFHMHYYSSIDNFKLQEVLQLFTSVYYNSKTEQ